MEEFKRGDVVVLTSYSSIRMTVEDLYESKVHCVWFDNKNELHREVFHKESLKTYKGGNGIGG